MNNSITTIIAIPYMDSSRAHVEAHVKLIWGSFEAHLKLIWSSFEAHLKLIWSSLQELFTANFFFGIGGQTDTDTDTD